MVTSRERSPPSADERAAEVEPFVSRNWNLVRRMKNSASEADLIRNQKLLNEPHTVPSQRSKELAVNKLTCYVQKIASLLERGVVAFSRVKRVPHLDKSILEKN